MEASAKELQKSEVKSAYVLKASAIRNVKGSNFNILDKANIPFYVDFVSNSADDKSSNIILNNSHAHSQITLGNILKHTQREIYIYTSGFRKDIVKDEYDFLKNFERVLREVETIKIIIDEPTKTNVSDLIGEYQVKRKKNISVRLMNDDFVKNRFNKHFDKVKENLNLDESCKNFHLQTADGRMLRLEYDYNNKKAFVNFNHPETAKGYQAIFEEAFKDLQPFTY